MNHLSLLTAKKGFTITEVVVSALIFSIAVTGIYSLISVLKKPAVDSKEAMTAAFLGKQILDNLRSSVDAESWDTGGPLNPAGGPSGTGVYNALTPITVDGVVYTPSYTVTDDNLSRRVQLTISWPDR